MNFHELFDSNAIFAQTKRYILRRIQPEEKSYYTKLAKAETPDFLVSLAVSSAPAWEELLSEEHLTCSILQRDTLTFCGFCQLQWIFSPTPELGIDLLPSYQKQGVASEVLPAFLAQAKKLLPIDHFYSRIRKNNLSSQRLAEKIGGVCIGEKSLLPAHVSQEMLSLAEKEFPSFFFYEYFFPANSLKRR